MKRRSFIKAGELGLSLALFSRPAEGATFFLKHYLSRPPKETPFYTPNQDFYIVNYARPPELKAEGWSLRIAGNVKRPLELSYTDILARPPIERVVTLECIDNEVSGDLISNALWKGVSLRRLLEEAGPDPTAQDVVMYAADDYSESITLDRAMNYEAFLAYQMNGETLPKVHGFPLRAVAPGLYGIKNVKWLSRIELVDYDYKGYWQQRGWTDDGQIKVTSWIDAPGAYNTINTNTYTIRGMAFSGGTGIGEVSVSTDGGRSWEKAEIETVPSLSCWVPWRFEWRVPSLSQSVEIKARATDKIGRTQSPLLAGAFPDGTSGLHSVVAFTESRP